MGASVINMYFRMVMSANRLRINQNDFLALHSMWRISTSSEVPKNRYDLP